MLVADAIAFVAQRRAQTISRALSSLVWGGLLAAVLAIVLCEDIFGCVRLLCYGLFVHGPVLLGLTSLCWYRRSRWMAGISLFVALALIGVAIDAFLIEPQWLKVSCYELTSPKLERPLKIVVVADLQTDNIGEYERQVLQRVVKERPGLILLAGDYLQAMRSEQRSQLRQQLNRLLREVQPSAPLGIHAVRGNTDGEGWTDSFAGIDVLAYEESRTVSRGAVTITGLSVSDSFRTNLHVAAAEAFHIVLGHAPNYALGHIQADLLIAGHTHGGQVRLPFFGPLLTFARVPRAPGVQALPPWTKTVTCSSPAA